MKPLLEEYIEMIPVSARLQLRLRILVIHVDISSMLSELSNSIYRDDTKP
jgi:hypothetical protein